MATTTHTVFRIRAGAVLLSAALAFVMAACGGGDDVAEESGTGSETGTGTPAESRSYSATDLTRFSVQLSDLPSGYTTQSGYPKTSASAEECLAARTDASKAAAKRLQDAGLQTCYAVVFSKQEGQNSNRPGSQAYLYPDTTAAATALPLLRQAMLDSLQTSGTASGRARADLAKPDVGDESVPGVGIPVIGDRSLRFVFWRAGNIVLLAGGSDVLNDITEQELVSLAKKIDARGRQR